MYKMLLVIASIVLCFVIILTIWGSGGWVLNIFPDWIIQIILGIDMLFIIIITAFLLALGIIKFKEIGTKNE